MNFLSIAEAAPPAKKPVKPQFARSTNIFPQAEQLGVGLYVGLPIGITGKYWLRPNTAIDGRISFLVQEFFNFSIDQVWHFPGYFGPGNGVASQFSSYYGVGGGVYTWSDSKGPTPWKKRRNTTSIHARFPVGVEWLPHAAWGFFVELTPGISILPGLRFVPEAAIGLRFYL